jgi:uncharacterized membrane protein YqhA
MNRLIGVARFLIIIAVVSTLVAAIALLLFGAIDTVLAIQEFVATADFSSKTGKELLVKFIEIVDIFLLATVLYIIALGLYELFVDDSLPVPNWLEINNLDDLKDKLVGVVIVVIAVSFLGQFVSWNGQTNLLIPGGAAAVMIASLTYFLAQKPKKAKLDVKDEGT